MILVTGATGFLGGNLVKELVRRGERVRVLVRQNFEVKGVEVARGDLRDKESLKRAVAGCELVFHLAASLDYFVKQRELDKVNVDGSRNLMEACVGAGVKRVVYASSVAVADKSRYGKSKRRAEEVVMGYKDKLGIVSLRFAPIYGPGSKQMVGLMDAVMVGVMGNIKKRKPYWTHMVDVRNAVQGLVLAMDGKPGVWTIADEHPIRADELYERVRKRFGVPHKEIPYWMLFVYALVSELKWRVTRKRQNINLDYLRVLTQDRQYDISKSEKLFGYYPDVKVEDGIEDLLDWYVTSFRSLSPQARR